MTLSIIIRKGHSCVLFQIRYLAMIILLLFKPKPYTKPNLWMAFGPWILCDGILCNLVLISTYLRILLFFLISLVVRFIG